MFDRFVKAVKNKKVSLVGIDALNVTTVPFLCEAGAVLTVYSKTPKDCFGECRYEFEACAVPLVCGEDCLDSLSGDIIIRTPFLEIDSDTVCRLEKNGALVISETELFLEYCPCQIITAKGDISKLYASLRQSGRPVYICGDGYRSLLPRLNTLDSDGVVLAVNSELFQTDCVRYKAELVRTVNGVRFYDDSFASTPARTVATLRSFEEKVILIAGGHDKNHPFDELAKEIPLHVKALFLTGDAAKKIHTAVKGSVAAVTADSFDGAVNAAAAFAKEGDIVLLSPACASFDAFSNFKERSERFEYLVNSISERKTE